jgi:hypothetical protein
MDRVVGGLLFHRAQDQSKQREPKVGFRTTDSPVSIGVDDRTDRIASVGTLIIGDGEGDWLEVVGALHAASRAACTAGNSRAIRTAMIAITTSNSIKVKPRRFRHMRHLRG